ncbi:dual specificity protein phosphatase family protein [Candidatus Woesearchaeota archaeon]|nr:dual specificity protein phosphatase family protein [Candidatus Woesearchaeota archaeon]
MNGIIKIGSLEHQAYMAGLKSDIACFKHSFGTIDWVTQRIALGPYPFNREHELVQEGVTHTLNVGDGTYHPLFRKDIFKEVAGIHIYDLREIPVTTAKEALSKLHQMLHTDRDSKVYVHCSAGQNRSPNILWLYLIALGLAPQDGIQLISTARLDAIPGHQLLVPRNSKLIEEAQRFGKETLQTFYAPVLNIKI